MKRTHVLRSTTRPPVSCLLAMLALGVAGLCNHAPPALAPAPGASEYRSPALVAVAGGQIDVAGGNLVVGRVDLSIDTRLGALAVGAVYNSASESWLWSFDIDYSGQMFTGPTGAVHDVSGIGAGDAIPGTHWVVLDATHLKTKGGLVHEFDANGRLARVHWSSSALPALVFHSGTVAGEDRTISIAQSTAAGESPVFAIAYDASARVQSIADRAGRVAEFTYTASGQLATARDGLDVEQGTPGTRYEYQGGKLTAATNSEAERVEYGYTAQRVTSVRQVGEGSPVTSFAYYNQVFEDPGNLYTTLRTDPLGFTTTYRYDSARQLHEVENALGETTVATWGLRRPLSQTRPNGTTTTWTYSEDDVGAEVQPSGNVVLFTYASGGVDRAAPLRRPILRIEDDLGVIEERSYDASGRLLTLSNGAGETQTLSYDMDEMISSLTSAIGVETQLASYGEHGHPEVVDRGGSGPVPLQYDAVGNLLASPRPDSLSGGVASRSYDADRNLASLVVMDEPNGYSSSPETITLTWRSDGRLLRVLRPYGGETLFSYDALGRLVARSERVSPGSAPSGDWVVRSFEWDALGRPTSVGLPNGMRRETVYDAVGRVQRTRTLTSGGVESDVTASYAAGELVSLSDPARGLLESYSYDGAGRLASVIYSAGERLDLGYDGRSRVATQTYRLPVAGGSWSTLAALQLGYDAAGRLSLLSQGATALVAKTYASGRIESIATANGLDRAFEYDAVTGRPTGTATMKGAVQIEDSWQYNSPSFGGSIALAGTSIAGGLGNTSEFYDYYMATGGDGADRRVHTTHGLDGSAPSGNFFYHEVFYDHLSNVLRTRRTEQPVSTMTWVYNAEHNRLLEGWALGATLPLYQYTYDAAGFVTSRSGVAFQWTARGRIASMTNTSTGQAIAAFGYDALGRRVSRTIGGESKTWRFGGAAETDGSGTPVALDLGEVRIDLAGSSNLYRHSDFRGNIKFVTDANGDVATHYAYDAYGLIAVQGSDADHEHRFAQGLEIESPGGLMLLGARLYDPLVARFLSPDPVFNPVNSYAYTLGNPVDFWDPAGSSARGIYFGTLAFGGGVVGGIVGVHLLGPVGLVVGPPIGALVFLTAGNFVYGSVTGNQGLSWRDVAFWLGNQFVLEPGSGDAEFGDGSGAAHRGAGADHDAGRPRHPGLNRGSEAGGRFFEPTSWKWRWGHGWAEDCPDSGCPKFGGGGGGSSGGGFSVVIYFID